MFWSNQVLTFEAVEGFKLLFMKKRQKLLRDEQWELIAPLLPEGRRRKNNRGRPQGSNRADSADSANRRSGRTVSSRRVSLACNLLAAAEAVAGRRRVAGCVASILGALDEEGC
jgi:hypothetical protein